jgi:tRNA(Ile2) C34 agmatinyltransferase TiaS
MPYCPECGGEMRYIAATRHYVCQSCGLSITQQELIELRDELRTPVEDDEKERRRKEYLKWWLSSKKGK